MKKQPEKLTELLKLLQLTEDEEVDCDLFWDKAAYLAEIDFSLNPDQVIRYSSLIS